MSDKKATNKSTGLAVVFLLYVFGAGIYQVWLWLDQHGYMRHVATVRVTAGPQWIQGETKECASAPVSSQMATPEHKYGDVFTEIDCEDGPSHNVKVEFYGQQLQPGVKAAIWSCTRNNVSTFNDQAFSCKQTGAY